VPPVVVLGGGEPVVLVPVVPVPVVLVPVVPVPVVLVLVPVVVVLVVPVPVVVVLVPVVPAPVVAPPVEPRSAAARRSFGSDPTDTSAGASGDRSDTETLSNSALLDESPPSLPPVALPIPNDAPRMRIAAAPRTIGVRPGVTYLHRLSFFGLGPARQRILLDVRTTETRMYLLRA